VCIWRNASIDCSRLKEKLDPETYDKVRAALDLEPMGIAFQKGLDINYRIKDNLIGQPHVGKTQ